MSDLLFTPDELQDEFIDEGSSPEQPPDEYDQPDGEFLEKEWRSPVAKRYEKKLKKNLNTIFRAAIAHEATVPDAAAILLYGPDFCEKWGNLAATDKRVRRGIDWLADGTENPYLAAAIATLPLVMQLYRNHEESLSPTAAVKAVKASRARAKDRPGRQIRIPFTKRAITIRFRIAAGAIQNLTNDPVALTNHVFGNPDVIQSLQNSGITNIAFNGVPNSQPRP